MSVIKPDYDESRQSTYEVTYRNFIGIKMPKYLTVNFQKLQVTISEVDNGKVVETIKAANIKQAIKSQHVESQVTILTQGISREAYKVWVDEKQLDKVRSIIRDIDKLVELYKDLQEENAKH